MLLSNMTSVPVAVEASRVDLSEINETMHDLVMALNYEVASPEVISDFLVDTYKSVKDTGNGEHIFGGLVRTLVYSMQPRHVTQMYMRIPSIESDVAVASEVRSFVEHYLPDSV